MKSKHKQNRMMYFLVIFVTIIVYLVIHLYYGGFKKDAYQCNVGKVDESLYTVKSGESLETIAKMYNISVEELMKANNLSGTELIPGQKIVIPKDENDNTNRQPINSIIASKTKPIGPEDDEIRSLSFAHKNVSVKKGDTIRLIVEVKPAGADSSNFTWTSSDPSVVSVDENGNIKGIKEGTAIITVTSPNGKTATIKVTVEPNEIKVQNIKLNPSELSLNVGSSSQISAIIEPENATNRELEWESSDPNIATVDENGVVKGINPGTVTITAKTKDGTVVSKTTVTVEPAEIESLDFAQKSVIIKKGDTSVLIVEVKPVGSDLSQLTWTSSDPSVVSVDENGNIKGLEEGKATITVTSPNGKTATIEVIVNNNIVFEYEYDNGNYIYLINQFPISDEIGKTLQGDKHTQDFKLRFNEDAQGVRYVITAEKLDDSDLKEEWTKLYLVNDGTDVANCYRANGRIKSFDEYAMYNSNPKERVLYEGTITASEAARGYKDFTFRMWVSEDLQLVNSDYLSETKTFKTRINVYAVGN